MEADRTRAPPTGATGSKVCWKSPAPSLSPAPTEDKPDTIRSTWTTHTRISSWEPATLVRPASGYTFEVQLVDWRTSKPVRDYNAAVNYPSYPILRNPLLPGRFIVKPSDARFRLQLDAPGCVSIKRLEIALDPKHPSAFREIEMGPGATITGRVTASGGDPVAGATVVAAAETDQGSFERSNISVSARTAADGTFSLPRIPPGPCVLQIRPGETGHVRTLTRQLKHGHTDDIGAVDVSQPQTDCVAGWSL